MGTVGSVVQDTIFKIVSCIFKIQDSILSCILRYFLKVSLSCILKILFNTFGRYFSQDTFHPKNLVNYFKSMHNSNLVALSGPLLPAINETALKQTSNSEIFWMWTGLVISQPRSETCSLAASNKRLYLHKTAYSKNK